MDSHVYINGVINLQTLHAGFVGYIFSKASNLTTRFVYSNVLKLLFFFRIFSHFYLGPSVSNVLENANHKKPILFVIFCPLFGKFPDTGR